MHDFSFMDETSVIVLLLNSENKTMITMARIEKNENIEKKQLEIPLGNSVEEINIRKKIILEFYREWKQQNPTQRKYNVSLKEYVNIRNVSINETCFRASKSYLSTLAVLQLDAVLTMAKKIKMTNAKPNDKNQKPFNKMILMECNLPGIGKVKLTVGVKRRSFEKIQYCITAIESQ